MMPNASFRVMQPSVALGYGHGGHGDAGTDELWGTLLKWALHRLERDAAALGAGCRNWHRLGSRRDGAARRAKPTAAAHAVLWPHDLVR
jgi:hypothetical protein